MQLTNLRLEPGEVGGWTTHQIRIISPRGKHKQIIQYLKPPPSNYLNLYEELLMHQYPCCCYCCCCCCCCCWVHLIYFHIMFHMRLRPIPWISSTSIYSKMDDHCRRLLSSALGSPMTDKGAFTILFTKGSCNISDRNLFPVWGDPSYLMRSKQERNTHQCQEWFQHTYVSTYNILYHVSMCPDMLNLYSQSHSKPYFGLYEDYAKMVNHLLIGTAQKGPRCF